MKRYESYLTRRLPLPPLYSPGGAGAVTPLDPADVARVRLAAVRDLMRMEMPDRVNDITDSPIQLPNCVDSNNNPVSLPRAALSQLYYNRLKNAPPTAGNGQDEGQAELLYMIISMGSPEDMEDFSPSEIGDTNQNGYPEFLDGWGNPIRFIRWAPGFSQQPGRTGGGINYSDIQIPDPVKYHDPFDVRNIEPAAYKLIPLIYSSGSNTDTRALPLNSSRDPGLNVVMNSSGSGYRFAYSPPNVQSGGYQPPGMMFTNTGASNFLKIAHRRTHRTRTA